MRVCMALKVSLDTYACLHDIESVTCYVCVSASHWKCHLLRMRVCMALKVSLAAYACLHDIESVTC